jgi:hypothetical protein
MDLHGLLSDRCLTSPFLNIFLLSLWLLRHFNLFLNLLSLVCIVLHLTLLQVLNEDLVDDRLVRVSRSLEGLLNGTANDDAVLADGVLFSRGIDLTGDVIYRFTESVMQAGGLLPCPGLHLLLVGEFLLGELDDPLVVLAALVADLVLLLEVRVEGRLLLLLPQDLVEDLLLDGSVLPQLLVVVRVLLGLMELLDCRVSRSQGSDQLLTQLAVSAVQLEHLHAFGSILKSEVNQFVDGLGNFGPQLQQQQLVLAVATEGLHDFARPEEVLVLHEDDVPRLVVLHLLIDDLFALEERSFGDFSVGGRTLRGLSIAAIGVMLGSSFGSVGAL